MDQVQSLAHYFLNLTIENVRCFGAMQEINLCNKAGGPRQWTIILGDNGVGKTTLLKAFGTVFSWSKLDDNLSLDHFVGASKALSPKYGKDLSASSWEFGEVEDFENTPRSIDGTICSVSREGISLITKSNVPKMKLKVVGYGAARRIGTNGLAADRPNIAGMQLFDENISLLNAEEWFAQEDYAAKLEGNRSDKLERIKSILKELLEVSDIKMVANQSSKRVGVVVVNEFGEVGIHDLSLGQKTLIAWTVDLAKWMYDWYPTSPNPLSEPAVVLVDEIDLHLHPKFQRRLIHFLTDKFPRVQFIVTAHSPLIVQSVDYANVVLLEKEGDQVKINQKPGSFEGWRLDQLLTSELYGKMEPMSPSAMKKLRRRSQLVRKSQRSKEEEKELKVLDATIEAWPNGETEEDRESRGLIRKAAEILKSSGKF